MAARDYTPYEGIAVKGWPVSTMVRGKFVVRDGALVGTLGAAGLCARARNRRWRSRSGKSAMANK